MHYLLFYEVGHDFVSRREAFRSVHIQHAQDAVERGELLLGGALAKPVDAAVLLFKGDSPEVAEKFARADPYVTSGAVERWHVREWTTVVGDEAAKPISPASSPAEGMILRMWKGRSTAEKVSEYVQHVIGKVLPALRSIQGHRGAYLLRRNVNGAIEMVVLTLWGSMDAVRRFAGPELEKAVVEPEARAMLIDFDESVTHFEVVHRAGRTEN